jgi:hypothetical protein
MGAYSSVGFLPSSVAREWTQLMFLSAREAGERLGEVGHGPLPER